MVPVALAVICLVAAARGRGRLDPVGESSKRFRCRAEPAPFNQAIKSYAQKEKQSQQKSSFPKPASDQPERGRN
jgi:hypothetical protein